jgi:integrase
LKTPYKKFLKSCNFDDETVKVIPLKGLRDTFASLMLASGTDVRTVAGLMGHSQPTLTLNTYGQFLPSQWGAAADVFTPLFEQANKIEADSKRAE